MTRLRLPKQLEVGASLVRSWTVDYPRFYGERTTHAFVDALLEEESRLMDGRSRNSDPFLCRVLAAYHGPKGAKVPLSVSTVSGCVRPAFVALNPWIWPGTPSCYDGNCYLFHSRAVPAKKNHEVKVRAHKTPKDGLLAAARLARHFGLPIRDNQSSDGSMSMALPIDIGSSSQLTSNLCTLNEAGYADVPYLCFSSGYVCVPDAVLKELAQFPNLVVHVTVSGWHSREENMLRLTEFGRYAATVSTACLRVVNRQDWSVCGKMVRGGGAQCENWLLEEIVRRRLCGSVIRTPFHSVHPFPGSDVGNLGSRYLANIDYSNIWQSILPELVGECCTTGKCKTCPTRCGTHTLRSRKQYPLLSARAFDAMLHFETIRQHRYGSGPLAFYTARILARKAMEQYQAAGEKAFASVAADSYAHWNMACNHIELTPLQRRRLSNDCHALVVDGLDRHGLWRGKSRPLAKRKEKEV
jgi:hypothetical protein